MTGQDSFENLARAITNAKIGTLRENLAKEVKAVNPTPLFAEDRKRLKHQFFELMHCIAKYSCLYASVLIWTVLTFFIALICWMTWVYVNGIINNYEELHSHLLSLWKVLSGAFVLGFIQLAISLIKKNSSDD